MADLDLALNDMKKMYREIFIKTVDAIQSRVDELKPQAFSGDIFDKFAPNSVGSNWQKAVLDMFENDISKEIYRKWQEVLSLRENYECKGCATCCNLACSEYSYDELKKRASDGDNFAKQFTSIFIPYENQEDAKKVYPDYLELLSKNHEGNVYFYHCPKLNECKRCSDYGNRPKICRDFPDNPLDILPESCGFYEWRKKVQPVVMMLHAMAEIIDYYKLKVDYYENTIGTKFKRD